MKKLTVKQSRAIIFIFACVVWAIALIFLCLVVDFKKVMPRFSIGLVILGLINCAIAKTKNKSGLKWFLLTFLFGPLTTVFLLISNKKETAA